MVRVDFPQHDHDLLFVSYPQHDATAFAAVKLYRVLQRVALLLPTGDDMLLRHRQRHWKRLLMLPCDILPLGRRRLDGWRYLRIKSTTTEYKN